MQEVVASVSRSGEDVRLTLFDSALQIPLLEVDSRSGRRRILFQVEGFNGEAPMMILALLETLHQQRFSSMQGGHVLRNGFSIDFQGSMDADFPREMRITGRSIAILVRTLDVTFPGDSLKVSREPLAGRARKDDSVGLPEGCCDPTRIQQESSK